MQNSFFKFHCFLFQSFKLVCICSLHLGFFFSESVLMDELGKLVFYVLLSVN